MDVSLNQAQCLRDTVYFGYTRVQNVCNGAFTDIPWGFGYWFMTTAVCSILLAVISFYVWLEYPRWRWMRRQKAAGRL
jgi:hypothetical protein